MYNEAKKDAILKLLICFPSATSISRDQAAEMTAEYVKTLRCFSLPIVFAACEKLKRINSAFPPSAGQLYQACVDTLEDERRMHAKKAPKLPLFVPPVERLSPADKAASQARVQAMRDKTIQDIAAASLERSINAPEGRHT